MLEKNTKGFLYGLRALRHRRNFLRMNQVQVDRTLVQKRGRKQNETPIVWKILELGVFFCVLFLMTIGITVCLMPEIRTIVFEFMKNQFYDEIVNRVFS